MPLAAFRLEMNALCAEIAAMRFVIRRLATPTAVAAVVLSTAQLPAQEAVPPSMPTPTASATSYELSPETTERLARLLPNSFASLNQRQPIQVAVIGNTLTDLSAEPTGTPALRAFPGVFASELAKQFYYTGGVRLLGGEPAPDGAAPAEPRGPEIALRYLGRQDMTVFTAGEALQTFGSQSKPNILFLCIGLEEAQLGSNPGRFESVLEDFLHTAEEQKIDVILVGPPLPAEPPIEASFGRTRLYTQILRDAAAAHGLPFADPGDLSRLTPLTPLVVEPGPVFESIATAYRAAFESANLGEGGLHARLGEMIFKDLIEGPPPVPWSARPVSIEPAPDGTTVTATFEISHTQGQELSLVQLPLITQEWNPMKAEAALSLPPMGKSRIKVVYQPLLETSKGFRPSITDTTLLPILIVAEGKPRIADLSFTWQPVALTWDQETHFNVESDFALKASLSNTSDAELQANWTATWEGQTITGTETLPAKAVERLELDFKIPDKAKDLFRLRSPVVLEVKIGKRSLKFQRQMEIVRNFALVQRVPLTTPPFPPQPLEPKPPGITLRADADTGMLFLTCLLDGVDLQENPANGLAYECLINLDARTYGKRLMPGATRSIRITGKAPDGAGSIAPIAPWAFGTGYAAEFDPAEIKATLDSTRTGQRRLTVVIPRTYLYLHEWALGNGNSQLGIDLQLNLWRALSGRDDPAIETQTWSLTASPRHPDDAEGLAVLELADEATLRWTVLPD